MSAERGRPQPRRVEASVRLLEQPLSHPEAYKRAAQLLTERVTHNGEAVSYKPYYSLIEGEKGMHYIASSYASVEINGRKAWFEVVQDTPETPITHLSFATSHPLSITLGDTQSPDTQKFSKQIHNPQPGNSIIRLVGFEEVPLIDGYERVTDPAELALASQKIVEHLLPEDGAGVVESLPTTEELQRFSSQQLSFTPLFQAANGTIIGEGRVLNATVKDGETKDVFAYPVQTTDEEGKAHKTYIISTKEINPKDPSSYSEMITREDSICGCEKFGTHALLHSCGHEILGSLRNPGNTPVIIAWDPAADNYANGSVMHSFKSGNIGRLPGVSDELVAFSKQYEYDVALVDRRQFAPLAQSLAAAQEFFGATTVTIQTTNKDKSQKLRDALPSDVALFDDAHEIRVVPEHVRALEGGNGERPHKYPTRWQRQALLPE